MKYLVDPLGKASRRLYRYPTSSTAQDLGQCRPFPRIRKSDFALFSKRFHASQGSGKPIVSIENEPPALGIVSCHTDQVILHQILASGLEVGEEQESLARLYRLDDIHVLEIERSQKIQTHYVKYGSFRLKHFFELANANLDAIPFRVRLKLLDHFRISLSLDDASLYAHDILRSESEFQVQRYFETFDPRQTEYFHVLSLFRRNVCRNEFLELLSPLVLDIVIVVDHGSHAHAVPTRVRVYGIVWKIRDQSFDILYGSLRVAVENIFQKFATLSV